MGLHAVSQFIKQKYPQFLHEEHLSLFAHDRVFMDIAGYLFKYICIHGAQSTRWVTAMFNLILTFRKNGVHLIPVFDGKAPDAKADEQKDRRDKRQKSKQRLADLKKAIESYEAGSKDTEVIKILHTELENLDKKGTNATTSLLRPSAPTTLPSLSETTLTHLSRPAFQQERQFRP